MTFFFMFFKTGFTCKLSLYTFSDYVKWVFHTILSFTLSFLIGQFGHVNFRRETFINSIVIDFIIVKIIIILNKMCTNPQYHITHMTSSVYFWIKLKIRMRYSVKQRFLYSCIWRSVFYSRVVHLQNCVRQPCPLSNMIIVAKNKSIFNNNLDI
jgi:hypothetical protein